MSIVDSSPGHHFPANGWIDGSDQLRNPRQHLHGAGHNAQPDEAAGEKFDYAFHVHILFFVSLIGFCPRGDKRCCDGALAISAPQC